MTQPGSRLAHYEIVSALGKGGMGEVWRARDTKLGREVAIKTLPVEFAEDPDRLARFEREAKLLAALNHPNIAAIHGLEESDDTRFLVMELVEGETLSDRLQRGPIPVEESLKLALQIAEGLEAAHEKSVVHRDLKPANIKITPEGRVKVLDFGLAKAFIGEQADVNLSNSPTLSMQATQAGVILGTAAYMSPEQARGEPADQRADLWAFGVVLFEMLTGRRMFDGRTVSDVLAGVLAKDPPWGSLPPNLHPRLIQLLERCLAKELKDRYTGIGDARVDIEAVLDDPAGVTIQPAREVVQAAPPSKLPWLGAVVLSAIITGMVVWTVRPEPHVSRARFAHLLPDVQRFTNLGRPVVAISPDGERVVYVANNQLWLRAIDTLESTPVPGTLENPTAPFFSPDGQWIGYFSQTQVALRKIAVGGGAPITLTPALNPFGQPHWSDDDTIVWGQAQGVMKVAGGGGTADLLVESWGPSLNSPRVLPGGESVLYYIGDPASGEVWAQSLTSGDRKTLFQGTAPRYIPTGHIVYELDGVLLAVPFDLDSLDVSGGPVSLVEDVRGGPAQYDISDSGSLVYVPDSTTATAPSGLLAIVDEDGDWRPLDLPSDRYRSPRVSPDGDQVAVQILGNAGDSDIWVYDLPGGSAIRQLTREGSNVSPVWTPDGERITFGSDREGAWGIYWQDADGTSPPELLTTAEQERDEIFPESWTPDAETLSFVVNRNEDWSIWLLSMEDRSTTLFHDVPGSNDFGSSFSPDGHWIAFSTVDPDANNFGVRVQPFPPTGVEFQVTRNGETWPMWSRAGTELYSRLRLDIQQTVQLMGMSVSTEGSFTFGNPRILPMEGAMVFAGGRDFDVIGDSDEFLMVYSPDVESDTEPAQDSFNVVLNWFEEVKERAPGP